MRALRAVVVVALAASAAGATNRSPEVAAARARQMAQILGLEPLVARIERAPAGGGLEATVERLQLRDDVLAELQRASVLIDATLAQLQAEHAAAAGAQAFGEDRQLHAVARWNIAALLVGSGLSIVGTAMQFDGTSQAYAGDALILVGAAVAAGVSIVALTHDTRARVPHAIDTKFLAPLVGATPTADSVLPEAVWRYLDTPLFGEPASLRAQLVERWRQRGTLPSGDSPKARRKIELLTRPLSSGERVPADVLDDRAEMLADLRARVAGMHVDVEALLREVRAPAARPTARR